MREELTVGWKNYIFWGFKFVFLTRYLGNKSRVMGHVIKFKGFLDQLNNYTDIQPKISIDEISLLWLFCGC